MKKLISPEATQKVFTDAIIKSHNRNGFSAIDWFSWVLDDCLACFGKRLEKPWSEEQTKHLFKLGGLYSEAVITNPYRDILGSTYQELASSYGKKALGQYFTPYPVASCMAKMSFDPSLFENKSVVRISEPCSGSGVMVLAFISNLVDENPAFLKKVSLCCVDLDLMCVKMTTLQIMANNLIHPAKIGELISLRGKSLGDPKDLTTFYHVSTPDFNKWAEDQDHTDQIKVVIPSKEVDKTENAEPETEIAFIQPKKQMSIMDFFG